MQKIYLVKEVLGYEGELIIGVYSSIETAKKGITEAQAKHRKMGYGETEEMAIEERVLDSSVISRYYIQDFKTVG